MTEANIDNATAGQPGDGVTIPEVPATAEASASKSKRASWPAVARVRTGIVTKRHGLGLSRPGRKMIEVWHDAQRLRRELESEVKRRNGGRLSVLHIAAIQTICRLEQSCRAYEKTLRENESMSAADQRVMREAVCRWSAQRDNAITSLLADRPTGGGLDWSTPLPGQES